MQVSEYEKLRKSQKNVLIGLVVASAVGFGLGTWAGVSKWWWALPFCTFYSYFFAAAAYLTYRLRRRGGSPFSPTRLEVIKWMFTFKVEEHEHRVSGERSTIVPDWGKSHISSGDLRPIIGKVIAPNDPCPCGSGKKYKYCCRQGK